MEKNTSLSINLEQIKSVAVGFIIAEAGAILTTAALWVTSGNFDYHVFLALEGAAITSTAVNFFRKYIPSN